MQAKLPSQHRLPGLSCTSLDWHSVFQFNNKITTTSSHTSLDHASIAAISQASAPLCILFLPPDKPAPPSALMGYRPFKTWGTYFIRWGGCSTCRPLLLPSPSEGRRGQCVRRSCYEPAAELCSRPQLLGHRLVPVHGPIGTRPHSRR